MTQASTKLAPAGTLTEHDVISKLSERIVLHPALSAGIDRVLDLIEPRHMIIVGDSGCGKTTLCDELEQRLGTLDKEHWFGTQREIPAIFASVPSPVTPRSTAAALLRAMGVTRNISGTTYERTEELIGLFKSCTTKAVFLDDFQHLLSKGQTLSQATSRQLREVQDWIKSIIVRSGVTFVLLGLYETLALIDSEPQMSRRFTFVHELKPFPRPEDPKSDKKVPPAMVAFADDLMCHALNDTEYFHDGVDFRNDPDAAVRLYVATEGVPSPIKDLIVDAARDAYRRKERVISMANFARAFDTRLELLKAKNERLRRDGLNEQKVPAVNPFRATIESVRTMFYDKAA
jgi:hypothetical protein